ncbi:MAG: sporulation protein YtfJ [Clostridia bacterium]|nr:sporulation protein YtfJ [Clostridia bacterium]
MNDNRMAEIIEASVNSIKSIAGADTIIGAPINTPSGTTVIPVSKLSLGYVTGGVDYASKAEGKDKNFGGGGGTGVTMTPICFLVIDKEGKVEILNVGEDRSPDPIGDVVGLVERSPELIGKIKAAFGKKKKEETEE